jgi:hypothetical protein
MIITWECNSDSTSELWQIKCNFKYNFNISAFVGFVVWFVYLCRTRITLKKSYIFLPQFLYHQSSVISKPNKKKYFVPKHAD